MNDSTQIPARRQRKSRGKFAIIAVVGLAAIGFGAYKFLNKGKEESEYLFASIQTADVEDLVTATGTLQPRDYVDVGAQVSGQIEEIFVEVGDEVKKGDKLATIDATTAEARVEANRAQLESSKTSLDTQKTNLEKAERDYKRQVNLLADDATTQETMLNAETALANARRSVKTSELQIAQQEANMRIEAKNLGYTTITAPIDGTVMSIAVKEGQSVNASQNVPVVMQLADLGTMTVQADVSEADISKLYKGMNVYFTTLGAGQDRRWTGVLKRKEPKPKNQQGVVLYPALFDVQNEGGSLMPSATTQVYFIVAEARNVLTVPMAALQQGQQIAREMAAKEKEKNGGKDKKATAEAGPRPAGPAAAAQANAGAGAVSAGSAPATAAPSGAAPAQAGDGPAANGQPGNGQGMRANRPGGGFGGQRPGGGNFTPEQIEQMRARFRDRGGAGGAGGFGGFGGGMGMAGGGGSTRQPQQRRGTVMVKLADGKLEERKVVVGVSDRVHGQVIEGLKEGEEVVVGKRETTPVTGNATNTQPNNNNNNNNFRQGQGFPGGGNFRPF